MKTILCFENEELSCSDNTGILQIVRHLHPEDLIVMISAGDYASNGRLLHHSCKARAAKYEKAGADLVLSLPVCSVLGGYGKKEFAAIALVQNLRIRDVLITIPCVPVPGQTQKDCETSLHSCAMLMFTEQADYRSRLSRYLGYMSFRDAQVRTVSDCIPEAGTLLSCPENRQALWLLDAMHQLYFMAKTEYIPVLERKPAEQIHAAAGPFDTLSAAQLATLLDTRSAEELIDISGSTVSMVNMLFEKKEQIHAARSLEQVVTCLSLAAPEDRIRLFLLKAVIGVRKIHMQICGLHTYVPYCYVLAKDQGQGKQVLLQMLEADSWVPFIGNATQEQVMEETYRYLLQADKNAKGMLYFFK